jgi:hypothetical protein
MLSFEGRITIGTFAVQSYEFVKLRFFRLLLYILGKSCFVCLVVKLLIYDFQVTVFACVFIVFDMFFRSFCPVLVIALMFSLVYGNDIIPSKWT